MKNQGKMLFFKFEAKIKSIHFKNIKEEEEIT